MSRVFTRLFVRHHGTLPDELVQTIPVDDYTYVVRNITVAQYSPTKSDVVLYVRGQAGGDFWFVKEALETAAMHHQEIRHVLVAGDQLRVNTNSDNWVVYVTGYVLGPDS